jgi:hypothetical protein
VSDNGNAAPETESAFGGKPETLKRHHSLKRGKNILCDVISESLH